MQYEVDAHCHSIASGHAYSTIAEIALSISEKGFKMVGISDHGPALPGAPHLFHFLNLRILPEKMHGVELLRGVEANITDFQGNLDMKDDSLKNLDIVLAGLHSPCIFPGSIEENTSAIIGAIKNHYVDIIVHPGNPEFPIHLKEVLSAAKNNDTLIEINNSSLGLSRRGSEKNCLSIAALCKEMEVPVVAGSDSHMAYYAGDFGKVTEMFKAINMPENLIMNLYESRFKDFLRKKGKHRFC